MAIEYSEQLRVIFTEIWGNCGLPVQHEIMALFPSTEEVHVFNFDDEFVFSFEPLAAFCAMTLSDVGKKLAFEGVSFASIRETENQTLLSFEKESAGYAMRFIKDVCFEKYLSLHLPDINIVFSRSCFGRGPSKVFSTQSDAMRVSSLNEKTREKLEAIVKPFPYRVIFDEGVFSFVEEG